MRVLLIVLALILGACHSLAFAVSPQFTPSEHAEIERAAADWNAKTKRPITFDGNSWHIAKEQPSSGYNGWTSSSQRLIQISPTHPGATVYQVALHEFGHALGLQHTSTGLMQAFVVSSDFTPEVLAECRRVGACA